jgi:hypothetical protein
MEAEAAAGGALIALAAIRSPLSAIRFQLSASRLPLPAFR